MRKREMALACSSELVRGQHQSQAPAEFNANSNLGDPLPGQSFSSWWLLGLQTVTLVYMQSFALLGLIRQGSNLSLIHHLSNYGSH